MAVEIEVDVEGAATMDGKYRVTWTANTSTDMPLEVFKHTAVTERFDGVISVADLNYPTSKSPTDAYYRKDTASQVYATISVAEAAQVNVANALQDLVDAYKNGLADFLVTTTDTYI